MMVCVATHVGLGPGHYGAAKRDTFRCARRRSTFRIGGLNDPSRVDHVVAKLLFNMLSSSCFKEFEASKKYGSKGDANNDDIKSP
jgi:hypothetical protein